MFDSIVWFFLGASFYALLNSLLTHKETKRIYKTMSALNSVVMHSLHTEIKHAMGVKHASMKMTTQLPTQVVNSIIKKDEQFLDKWKNVSYITILSTVPERYQDKFTLMDLDEATDFLKVKL